MATYKNSEQHRFCKGDFETTVGNKMKKPVTSRNY